MSLIHIRLCRDIRIDIRGRRIVDGIEECCVICSIHSARENRDMPSLLAVWKIGMTLHYSIRRIIRPALASFDDYDLAVRPGGGGGRIFREHSGAPTDFVDQQETFSRGFEGELSFLVLGYSVAGLAPPSQLTG